MGSVPTTPLGSRLVRAGLAAATALALTTSALVATAPMVSADVVPYAVDFDRPAIPAGASNEAYLDCDADAGQSIPIAVTDPANDVTTYHVTAKDTSDSNAGRIFVEVGGDGLFSAMTMGHWSVAVSCPSYDTYTTGFEVVAPSLGLAVTGDRDYDCTTADGEYLVGDRETMCFHVTNSTGQDIRQLTLYTPLGAAFKYFGAGELPAGATYTSGANDGTVVPFAGATVHGLLVVAEIGQEDSGTFAVSDLQSFSFNELPAPLEVTITTGLTAGTSCPDAGGLVDRTVDPGTPVYFCYTAHNTSAITFHDHTVTDDVLGPQFAGSADLAPGEHVSYHAVDPVSAGADLSHTLTWWAQEDNDYSPLGEDYAVTATATAHVTVAGVPFTSTTTVTPAAVLPVAIAPEVVSTAAQFTG